MKKVLLVAVVALAAVLFFGLERQARLTFPNYDKHAEYYWVGDFGDPSECEEIVADIRARVPHIGARCAYATRFKVWWLSAQNLVLVQAPNVASLF